MRFEALGPLAVKAESEPVQLRPAHRRLLASLLLDAGNWVTTDTLIDRMWGETPPDTSRSTLHVHLSAVRRQLPEVLVTGQGAYRLDLDGHTFDVAEFSSLVSRATEQMENGRLREASDLASRAKSIWRGRPYQELDDVDTARAERARLIELSSTASVTLARALMLQGRGSESIFHLRAMVEEKPFNEAMWEELIHAYYLAGRQVDALHAFREAKSVLGDELGLEPGPRLRQMEEKVLLHDPTLMMGAASAIANNLPTLDSSFVGRDEDVVGVLDLLHQNRLVTITGAPGIGKTRLAIEVAARGIEGFPGGVWLARLAGARTEADTLGTIASAMSVTDDIETLGLLFEQLSSRPALVILDNCEHLLSSVRAFLAHRTHGAMLRVLATSRIRLGVREEVVWPLRELALPDTPDEMWSSPALQLLVDRVRAADPTVSLETADPYEVIDVCRKTGGVPLALELTARWVPSLDLKSVAMLTLSPAPAQASADPPHHSSVADAVAWSVALLEPDDQGAFEAASTFAAAFTAEAFAKVCLPNANATSAAAAIGRLVEASLLTLERGNGVLRYRMLEPIKDFAALRLDPRQQRTIKTRHSLWFVERARSVEEAANGPDEAQALLEVAETIADYRAAMRHLLDTGKASLASELAAGLTQYWIARYAAREGNNWLTECLAHDLDDAHRLRALSAAGAVAFFVGDYQRSADLCAQIHEIAMARGDRDLEARALYGMGRVELYRRPTEGHTLMGRSLTLFRQLGDTVRTAECLLVLGIHAANAGNAEDAIPPLTEAVEMLEQAQYPKFIAVGHRHLSLVAWHEDDEARAREHIEYSEAVARQSNDRRVLSGSLIQQALVEGKWGDSAKAASTLLEALGIVAGQPGVYFPLTAIGAMPTLIAAEEWSLAARLLRHFDRAYQEHGWTALDDRSAAAREFRLQIEAGLEASGVEPDYTPVPTSVISAELISNLETIVQSATL